MRLILQVLHHQDACGVRTAGDGRMHARRLSSATAHQKRSQQPGPSFVVDTTVVIAMAP